MAITTWAGFLQQLTRLLDGEDISTTLITPETLQQVISLGERRLYREVRSRWNEKDFGSVITSNNRAVLPTDFEAPSIVHFGNSALEPAAEEFVRDQQRLSRVRYFSPAGNYLTFGGPVSDNQAVQGRYYCRLPDLSETTLAANSLFLSEPDLFIFGCLSQAAPFFGELEILEMWEARYAGIRDTINNSHHRTAHSAGRMMVRPSARLLNAPRPNWTIAAAAIGNYADAWAADYA